MGNLVAWRFRLFVFDSGLAGSIAGLALASSLGGTLIGLPAPGVAGEGPQVGIDDQRLSDMGPPGDTAFRALASAIAYDPDNDRYLVVWIGDDDTGSLEDGELEVFGQLVDGATGSEIGPNDFRVSDMGPAGDPDHGASGVPAVAFAPAEGEFLVVWSGDDGVDGELEIYGQRISSAGLEVGANDFRISDMGLDGATSADAQDPAVAYNAAQNEFLVVWRGDDASGGTVDNEFEIYGQLIAAADGSPVGTNDFRISDMGPDGSVAFGANTPDVAWSSFLDQYAVVWSGDDDTPPLVDEKVEIFFQRLLASGAPTGANDVRLSATGPEGNAAFFSVSPAIAFSGDFHHEYAVAWSAVAGTLALPEGPEIYLRRVGDGGTAIGPELRISQTGPEFDLTYGAFAPDVTYDLATGEIFVAWHGDDDEGDLENDELEVYGELLSAIAEPLGFDDQRLSTMGPPGDVAYRGVAPAVAFGSAAGQLAVVWTGEDDIPPKVGLESEVFLQRVRARVFEDGFESGDLSSWSTR